MGESAWAVALVAAAGAHLGLELVVHLVVYPALAAGSVAAPAVARAAHEAHARRMSVAVGPVYGALVVSAGGLLAVSGSPLAVAALVVLAALLAVTAFLAVPVHGAIVRSPGVEERAALHRRLARVDLVRLALAVLLLVLAVAAVGSVPG